MRKLALFLFLLISWCAHAQHQQVAAASNQEFNGSVPTPPVGDPYIIVDNMTKGAQGYQHNYAVGTWADGTGVSGWYATTLSYTGTTGGYVEFKVNATKVEWYTETKTTHGIVGVSIDGGAETNIDLAVRYVGGVKYDPDGGGPLTEQLSSTPEQQVLVWSSGTITQAVHTIRLRCTGTKNAGSSGYYAITDFFKVFNPLTVPDTPDPTPYNRYVQTWGNNSGNNCSSESFPCQTVVYTLSQSISGDKVKIGPGTFTENSYLVIPSGVSIWGEGLTATTLKVNTILNFNVDLGALQSSRCLIQYTGGGGNQTLKNLTIEGNNRGVHGGIWVDRTNIDIDNVRVMNFDYFGIYVAGTDHSLINSYIIDSSEAGSSFSTGSLMVSASTNFLCDNVTITESEGYGVKAWGASSVINTHIFRNGSIQVPPNSPYGGGGIPNIAYELHNVLPRNCLFENNYVDNALSIIRPTSYDNDGINSIEIFNNTFDMLAKGGGTTAINAPLELGVHNAEVHENHFVGGKHAYIPHWNASETEPAVNWSIHHNTFYCVGHPNSPTPIMRSSYAGLVNVYFYNNTMHIPPGMNFNFAIAMTGTGAGGEASSNVNIINNIIYDQSTADTGVGGANTITRTDGAGGSWTSCNFRYNIINGMSTSLPGGWTSNNNLTGAPGLVGSGANPQPFEPDPFYRPAAGSPAIESGLNVGLPFTGSAPNRGRY